MDTSQYLNVFMDECQEHLQTLNQGLLSLEKKPDDAELLNSIFRAAHTLKGASSTMGFSKMSSVTHAMEDILTLIRKKELAITPEITNLLFDSLDLLEILSKGITEGKEEDIEISGVLQRLKKHTELEMEGQPSFPKESERRKVLQLRYTAEEKEMITKKIAEGSKLYHLRVFLEEECLLKGARAFMILRELETVGLIVRTTPSSKELEDERFGLEFIAGLLTEEPLEKATKALEKVIDVREVKAEIIREDQILLERRGRINDQQTEEYEREPGKTQIQVAAITPTVRVDIRKLDALMNLVGELVINRSQIEQISMQLDDQRLGETVEQLSRLTMDLRDQVLKTRMVAVEHVFSRFPRLVRDLVKETGKKVELKISGAETELDRTVIDEIGDPLVHIIRNSVDHGIESPSEREATGKPETGTISLEAYQIGNNVMISVKDDGRGIDPAKISALALEKGFITSEKLAEMTEEEIINLIYAPGFSTAEKVTDVSGRGVGMDVVKNTITKLGGTIEISSILGEGSSTLIRLPLTLAIIQTLMVQLGSEIYAIPTGFVDQTISVAAKDIKYLRNQEVTLLRGELIPLLRLQDFLETEDARNKQLEELDVVVFKTGDRRVGCVVDTLLRQQDVVIKSLGGYLGKIPGVAGATILGDGRVALIIDLRAVA